MSLLLGSPGSHSELAFCSGKVSTGPDRKRKFWDPLQAQIANDCLDYTQMITENSLIFPTAKQFRSLLIQRWDWRKTWALGSQLPPSSVLPSSKKSESQLPRNWGLPFCALRLLFQNKVKLRKFYSSRNLCCSQTGLMVASITASWVELVLNKCPQ